MCPCKPTHWQSVRHCLLHQSQGMPAQRPARGAGLLSWRGQRRRQNVQALCHLRRQWIDLSESRQADAGPCVVQCFRGGPLEGYSVA